MQITYHAVQQYRARVKPGLTYKAAERELTLLVEGSTHRPEPGTRLASQAGAFRPDSYYLELSDGIYAAIGRGSEDNPVVTTLVVRGGLSPQGRAKRRKARKHHVPKRYKREDRAYRRRAIDPDVLQYEE